MIYIDDQYTEAALHLALEYYLVDEKKPQADYIFFLWHNRPTLVVGKYQNTLQEINAAYVRQNAVDVVRRMSGGGTVYQDLGCFQYTFITPGDADEISFSQYISPVIDALRQLGVDAGFNGRNDLVIAGKKISGTSQYKHGGYTVHHGTLLFDTDIEALVRSTTVDQYKIISKGIASVRERVTNIVQHLSKPITPQQFREHMIRYLCRRDCTEYVLTQHDRQRIEQIANEKFRNWDWNYGASPRCNMERSARLVGGKVEWKLEVTKGVITACALFGDFFCSMDVAQLCQALTGCRYRREDIRQVFDRLQIDRQFYRITAQELLDTLIE